MKKIFTLLFVFALAISQEEQIEKTELVEENPVEETATDEVGEGEDHMF